MREWEEKREREIWVIKCLVALLLTKTSATPCPSLGTHPIPLPSATLRLVLCHGLCWHFLCLIRPYVLCNALLKSPLFHRILFKSLGWKHCPWPLFLHWTFVFCYNTYDSIFHIKIPHTWVWLAIVCTSEGQDLISSLGWDEGGDVSAIMRLCSEIYVG